MPALSTGSGMSSTPSISWISRTWSARPARREADAAIAHDRRGDAVLRRRRDVLAPGDLAVIMGVDVDKAGRDQFALGVDLFLAFACDLADLGDAAA